MTPPGFCLKSLPRQSGTGGGLAVLHRTSLKRNIAVSTRDFVFTAFEICEVRLSYDGHAAVFLSVYRPPPSRQNKLTNAMFFEQFSDLLESNVSCDRLFVAGDLNVHFDKPSDPTTSALNVVLDNLSLHQLVNVPTHRRGHTLDWLITNRATDVLDLTVIDMLMSDHFVISFDLLLRNPVREKRTIISRNIRAIDMHDFRTDVDNLLGSATQSNSTDPLGVYNTCLRQLLDRHAPCNTYCHGPYIFLNVVLDNLSLHQLVNVPTHRRGHTLVWLITNRATDVLDLTVIDMDDFGNQAG